MRLLASLLSACVPEEPGDRVQTAEPVACLEPPAGTSVPTGEHHDYLVEGTATANTDAEGATFTLGVRCDRAVRLLEITDADGGAWTVGYGWDQAGSDATPALALAPGDEVSLLFRGVASHGLAAGFVLTQGGHVIAAVEVGAWGPALVDGDLPVVIGEGPIVATDRQDCGKRVSREVRFVADEEILVAPVGSAELRVDGSVLTAWALSAWGYEDPTCEDVAGELSWALWREP